MVGCMFAKVEKDVVYIGPFAVHKDYQVIYIKDNFRPLTFGRLPIGLMTS